MCDSKPSMPRQYVSETRKGKLERFQSIKACCCLAPRGAQRLRPISLIAWRGRRIKIHLVETQHFPRVSVSVPPCAAGCGLQAVFALPTANGGSEVDIPCHIFWCRFRGGASLRERLVVCSTIFKVLNHHCCSDLPHPQRPSLISGLSTARRSRSQQEFCIRLAHRMSSKELLLAHFRLCR